MNKPISLEEALKLCSVWVETRGLLVERWDDEGDCHTESISWTLKQGRVRYSHDPFVGDVVSVTTRVNSWGIMHFPDDYMKLWRCWKVKPSKDEMNLNPWEEMKHGNYSQG